MRKILWCGSLFGVLFAATACGSKSADTTTPADPAATPTASGGGTTSTKKDGTAIPGALAAAFPDGLSVGSILVSKDGAALRLLDAAEADEDGPVTVVDEPQTLEEKEEAIDEILAATSQKDCFQIIVSNLTQPSCFSANLQRTTWEVDPDLYTITFPENVTQMRYGDGGIMQASEGDESCTAAAINYYTEDAVQYIQQGKQVFASMVCASKFDAAMALPAAGETKDYVTQLNAGAEGVASDDALTFTMAKVSRETAADGHDIYTTQLGLTFKAGGKPRTMYAYFRHQPEAAGETSSKGHVVVFQAGLGDSLGDANAAGGMPNLPPGQGDLPPVQGDVQVVPVNNPGPMSLALDGNASSPVNGGGSSQPNGGGNSQPNGGGNPQPNGGGEPVMTSTAGAASGDTRVAGVAVSYNIDGQRQVIALQRANFVDSEGDAHPAVFISRNGAIDHAAIAAENASHGVADNIVDTTFVLDPESPSLLAAGIVGWAASYSDGFWRTFAYNVATSASAETSTATFGYTPSYAAETGVAAPKAPNGIFCGWANSGSSLDANGTTNLAGSQLSGPALNEVQLQVSTKSAAGAFEPVAASSKLRYTVSGDCGGADSDAHDLATVDATGNVAGSFTAPAVPTLVPLGGVVLNPKSIDLSVDED